MKRILYISFVIAALLLPGGTIGARASFASDRLGEIASFIGRDSTWKGLPVTVVENNGTVEHIGYRFFNDDEIEAVGKDVCRFLERYALELDLPLKREKSVEIQLLEDGVVFRSGSPATLKSLCGTDHGDISLNHFSERRYLFRWSGGEMIFPSDVELISGKGMLENERRLPSEISSATFNSPVQFPEADMLDGREDGVLVLSGGSYYLSSLRADTYYDKDIHPLNDFNHKSETIANIFAGIVRDTDISLSVKMDIYGSGIETFRCSSASMAAYAIGNGCKAYAGHIADNGNSVDMLVIYRNIALSYNHVLRVRFPFEVLKNKKGTAEVRLTPFVPTHSVRYLFDETKR